jgi:hypothetical protein
MKKQFRDLITAEYGFNEVSIAAAPRQYVAETYTIKTTDRQTYFCKIVDKPLFIPKIVVSLPVLDAIHDLGFERIGYPIKTRSGALYLRVDNILIVLFNYIDAAQSYDFDYEVFGGLMGEVHALTPRITCEIPRERFSLKHKTLFEIQLDEILSAQSPDAVIEGLQRVLRKHEAMIKRQYAALQRLIIECSSSNIDLAITHGDAGGNVLVKSPTDLYLIDWDEILLAPPERDLWIHDHNPAFMTGYRSVFPEYRTNETARNYCICSQHFDYMAYYLADITSDLLGDYRAAKLSEFEAYFDGWIAPYIANIK